MSILSNEELIDWFDLGWNDEMNGTSSIVSDDELANKAYELGATHALVGDDISFIDLLTDEELLEIIKGGKIQ